MIVPFLVPVAAIFNEFVGLKQHFRCAFVFAGTLQVAFIYIYIYIEEVGIQMPLLYLLKSNYIEQLTKQGQSRHLQVQE